MASDSSTEKIYDAIIVGGGPIGLSTAYEFAVKEKLHVLVLEQYKSPNEHCSSAGFGRHWRTPYTERDLCELAVKTMPMWDQLMKDTCNPKLVKYSGVLWFGDSTVTTPEGNIDKARENLEELGQVYDYYDDPQKIREDFDFIAGAVQEGYKALYVPNKSGGTINVPELVKTYLTFLQSSQRCQIIEDSRAISIDYNDSILIEVTTDKGAIFKAKKVVLTASIYINEVLDALTPSYDYRINLIIYLWCSNYFKINTQNVDKTKTWPIWIYFAPPKEADEHGATDQNSYYGFPYEPEDNVGKVRVAPAFTSCDTFDFKYKPPPIDGRQIDKHALNFTSKFVENSMKDLDPGLNEETQSTCVAGFAQRVINEGDAPNPEPDPGAGFVLDFLPNSNDRIVLYTAGWAMKFVPIFGKILKDMAVFGKTEHEKLVQNMKIREDRQIMVSAEETKVAAGAEKCKKPTAKEKLFYYQNRML